MSGPRRLSVPRRVAEAGDAGVGDDDGVAARIVRGVAGLGSPLLLLIFLGASGATWAAGIRLSKATDALDARLVDREELRDVEPRNPDPNAERRG